MSNKKPFNLTNIINAVGGDRESLKEMIKIFLDTLPPLISEIKDALDKKDWQTVAKAAHSAKSNINMLEIKSSFAKMKEIEALAKAKEKTEKIPLLLEDIKTEMEKVFEELRKELE